MAQAQPREFTFVDEQGVRIFAYRDLIEKPRAVIQIAHGLGEYAARYGKLITSLNEAGFSVYSNDHRGHGQTGLLQHGGDYEKLGKLGVGGLDATIADIKQFTELIREEQPGLPIFLFGHSWGSLMAQILINQDSSAYQGIILSGTAYRTPFHMYGGDLNHRHKALGNTGYEWLSRDPEVVQSFDEDPLCFKADVLKLFGVVDGLKLYGLPSKTMAQVPILIQVGEDDSLGGAGSAIKLAESYRDRAGQQDVELEVYPEARHEIYNETNQADVRRDLIDWLNERI